ncbi:MAG: amidohydrolase family protein [Solirubrobacterales bacterium]
MGICNLYMIGSREGPAYRNPTDYHALRGVVLVTVDYHSHHDPPAYLELLEGRTQSPRARRNPDGGWIYTVDDDPFGNEWSWGPRFEDIDENLADMDRAGIDVSVLSPAPVGGELAATDIGFAKEGLGLLNQELAAVQAEHPTRFRALAMLPLQDTDSSIELLDTAVTDLGMAGVCIPVNLQGASIAPARLIPLYKRMEELGVPIVLHPSLRSTVFESSIKPSSGSVGRLFEVGLAWVYDTSMAVLSLISSGVFDECPELKVLHPHTGGVIPFITGRIRGALSVPKTMQEYTLERSVDEYLNTNVYVDIAAGSSPDMLALAVDTYGADHILFGSDYPFFPRSKYDELLDELDDELAEGIRSNTLPGIEVAVGEQR